MAASLLRDLGTCSEGLSQLRLNRLCFGLGERHEIHMGEWPDALVAICLRGLQSTNRRGLFATYRDTALLL
jgi:hypothetical protein